MKGGKTEKVGMEENGKLKGRWKMFLTKTVS
jgi:hypothetical protein